MEATEDASSWESDGLSQLSADVTLAARAPGLGELGFALTPSEGSMPKLQSFAYRKNGVSAIRGLAIELQVRYWPTLREISNLRPSGRSKKPV